VTPDGPTDEQLLAAAGSVRYSRLLVRGELDGLAVAVVDANGDDAVYECVTMRRLGGDWQESTSGSAGLLAEGWSSGVAYSYGRAPGADTVQVGLHGVQHVVRVERNGWWLVLARAEEDDRFDLSAVAPPRPVRRRRDGRPPRIAG
jgi:hypothetical protein